MKLKIYFFSILLLLGINSLNAQSVCPNTNAFTRLSVIKTDTSGSEIAGAIVNFSTHINSIQTQINYNNGTNQVLGVMFKIVPFITIASFSQPPYTGMFYGDTIYTNATNFYDGLLPFKIKITGLESNVTYETNFNQQGFYLFSNNLLIDSILRTYTNYLYANQVLEYYSQPQYAPSKTPLTIEPSWGNQGNMGSIPEISFVTKLSKAPKPKVKPLVSDTIFRSDSTFSMVSSHLLRVDSIFHIKDTSCWVSYHLNFVELTKQMHFNMQSGKNFKIVPSVGIADTPYPWYFAGVYKYFNGDTVVINQSNFNTVGEQVSFKVRLNGLSPSITYSVLSCFRLIALNGVFGGSAVPNFRFFIPFTDKVNYLSGGYPFFTTTDGKIKNDTMNAIDKIICPQNSSKGFYYKPGKIRGAQPQGGNGTFTYIWQKKNIQSGLWENCIALKNGQKDYVVDSILLSNLSYSLEIYRRVVRSNNFADTSRSYKVIYLPQNDTPYINIEPSGINGKDLLMKVTNNYPNGVLNINLRDKDSLKGTFKSTTLLSNIFTIPNTPNSNHHSYSIKINFYGTCPAAQSNTIFVTKPDGDGNIYPSVKIGIQHWIISNIRSTKFNDGSPIKSIANSFISSAANYSWYNNDSVGNAFKNGALYNAAVIFNGNNKNVCPTGWHSATVADWDSLIKICGGVELTGNKLKAKDSWVINSNPSNSLNFNGRSSGLLQNMPDSTRLFYSEKGYSTGWWALDASNQSIPAFYQLSAIDGRIYPLFFSSFSIIRNYQRSVRCVKNIK